MSKLLATLAAFGLMSGAAMAQAPMNFTDVDADANSELSFTELQAAWPDLGEAAFTAADADASGGLTVDELSALQAATMSASAPAPDAEPSPLDNPESITAP